MSNWVYFEGYAIYTIVTDNSSDIDIWVRNIRRQYYGQQIVVGLDCKWRPNTTQYMHNRTATLQLCVDTNCLIIQLVYLNYIPRSLRDFLGDPNFTFVGLGVQRDVSKIEADYGLSCSNIADVRELTFRRYPYMFQHQPGLKDLAREVVGLTMPKPLSVSLSDWQARWLDWTQIEYACVDAYASYRIGIWLINGV